MCDLNNKTNTRKRVLQRAKFGGLLKVDIT